VDLICISATLTGLGLLPVGATPETLPPKIVSTLEKSASLGLDRFPIGFWNYTNLGQHAEHMTQAEVAEWADAGFTVTMSPSFDPANHRQLDQMRRILDWADDLGMKLIVCDPRTHGPTGGGEGPLAVPDDQREKVDAAIADLGKHPATFGFAIGDEPGTREGRAWLECARITKHAAPDLHPFMNLLPWYPGVEERVGFPSWPEYLDTVARKSGLDFLCYDCYSQMNPERTGWDMYFANLREFREAGWRNGLPFWTTLLSVGHFNYRCPNYNELRWQFNTAVCSGANGILWFFYYMRQPHSNYRLSPVDENWDRTQTYYDIRRFQKAFHRTYGDLFLHLAPTRVTFTEKAWGGGAMFSPDELVSEVTPGDQPLLVGEFVDAQARRYVMLVNNSTSQSVRASLEFPGADVRFYSWNWDGNEVEGTAYSADSVERLEDGVRVWHWLAPGQEAVYRVDSEAVRNAPVTL